jgi:hypothetical protein
VEVLCEGHVNTECGVTITVHVAVCIPTAVTCASAVIKVPWVIYVCASDAMIFSYFVVTRNVRFVYELVYQTFIDHLQHDVR